MLNSYCCCMYEVVVFGSEMFSLNSLYMHLIFLSPRASLRVALSGKILNRKFLFPHEAFLALFMPVEVFLSHRTRPEHENILNFQNNLLR